MKDLIHTPIARAALRAHHTPVAERSAAPDACSDAPRNGE
jgi:hypothetical protein